MRNFRFGLGRPQDANRFELGDRSSGERSFAAEIPNHFRSLTGRRLSRYVAEPPSLGNTCRRLAWYDGQCYFRSSSSAANRRRACKIEQELASGVTPTAADSSFHGCKRNWVFVQCWLMVWVIEASIWHKGTEEEWW